MKKKIIYISGNEVFEMADIRAAFDEVRNALNLADDTVLFGVPVDADDALATSVHDTVTAEPITPTPATEPAPIQDTTPDADEPEPDTAPAPRKKTATRRTARTRAQNTPQDSEPDMPSPAAQETAPATDSAPVVPILSVLAAGIQTPSYILSPLDSGPQKYFLECLFLFLLSFLSGHSETPPGNRRCFLFNRPHHKSDDRHA